MAKSLPKILVIIPARGGSKNIPRKNIKLLGDKPLIAHSIEAVRESGVIDKLVVSTEDAEIAEVAEKFGAEIVERPEKLAQDDTPTEPVMVHALETLEGVGYIPDYIALIQCTTPFLKSQTIQEAVKKITESEFDACISLFTPDPRHSFKWRKKEREIFAPEFDLLNRPRRQDLPTTYAENGALFMTKTTLFKKTHHRLGGKNAKITAVVMSAEDSVEIDDEFEFFLAEQILKKRTKNDSVNEM